MSSTKKPMMVHKIILSSTKVVHLREMRVKYQNQAIQICGVKAKGNDALLGSLLQEELLKLLIVDIDGHKPSATEIEKIDDLFTYPEYLQIIQAMNKVMGGGELGEFQIEHASIGND